MHDLSGAVEVSKVRDLWWPSMRGSSTVSLLLREKFFEIDLEGSVFGVVAKGFLPELFGFFAISRAESFKAAICE